MTRSNLKNSVKRALHLLPADVGRFLYRMRSEARGEKVHPAEKRNLLKNAMGKGEGMGRRLLTEGWRPGYPDYRDCDGWNELLGTYRDEYISRGERLLGYSWQLIKATDYLEYGRSGNQMAMERPFRQNIESLTHLVMAELAEGNGRFLNQITDGVFYLCEMTSWAFSAHLWMQKDNCFLPDHDESIIEMGTGKVASLLAWTYHFLKYELGGVTH